MLKVFARHQFFKEWGKGRDDIGERKRERP
jgi:hypothetical protein